MDKPNLLLAVQLVSQSQGRDLSWMKVGKPFCWGQAYFKISTNGKLYFWHKSEECWSLYTSAEKLCYLLSETHSIEPITIYSTAEAKQAEKDMDCLVNSIM